MTDSALNLQIKKVAKLAGLMQVAPETLHGVTSEVFRLEALHHEVQATHEAQRGFRRFQDELHHNSGEQD